MKSDSSGCETLRLIETGLILVTHCVWHPHAMPFLWHKIPLFYYKLEKIMLFRGLQHYKCPKCEKMRGKIPELCSFTCLFFPFLGFTARMPLFSKISLERTDFFQTMVKCFNYRYNKNRTILSLIFVLSSQNEYCIIR